MFSQMWRKNILLMGLQIGVVTFINSLAAPQSLNLKVAHCQQVYSSNTDNPNTNHLMNRYTARGSQAVACFLAMKGMNMLCHR